MPDNMDIAIARATRKDASDIGRISVLSWRAAYRGMVADAYLDALSPEARAERFCALVAVRPEEYYIARADGRPAGTLVIGAAHEGDVPGAGEICALYTLKDYWGSGVGAALMRHGLSRLEMLGFECAILWVLEGNARARRFYEKHGFAPDGARKTIEIGGQAHGEVRYRRMWGNDARQRTFL